MILSGEGISLAIEDTGSAGDYKIKSGGEQGPMGFLLVKNLG